MSYKQYGIDGKEISRNDLQDKGVWCEDGVSQEEVFVKKYGGILGLVINPEKKINPYVPAFSKLDIILEDAPYHEYQQRVWDERGNAKGSYILNLRNGYFKRLI